MRGVPLRALAATGLVIEQYEQSAGSARCTIGCTDTDWQWLRRRRLRRLTFAPSVLHARRYGERARRIWARGAEQQRRQRIDNRSCGRWNLPQFDRRQPCQWHGLQRHGQDSADESVPDLRRDERDGEDWKRKYHEYRGHVHDQRRPFRLCCEWWFEQHFSVCHQCRQRRVDGHQWLTVSRGERSLFDNR